MTAIKILIQDTVLRYPWMNDMVCEWNNLAKTASANLLYSTTIKKIEAISLSSIVHQAVFTELCKTGCPNFNKKWSCPPYAPIYQKYIDKWQYLYIFFMKIDISQFLYIKNNYLKIKAANNILKSRADKFLRNMASQYGKYISTGSCRLCKPCTCKIDNPCKHPEKMSYSFEALGVDVGALVQKYFQSTLLWYKPKYLPQYTSIVCGLLTNANISLDLFHKQYMKQITS